LFTDAVLTAETVEYRMRCEDNYEYEHIVSRECPGIRLEWLRRTTKNLSPDSTEIRTGYLLIVKAAPICR
jgi:hypothetical protein